MTKNTLIPDDSDQVWSWLALSMISGIGYKKIRELIEQLGSAEELLKTSAEILSEQFHIAPKLAGRVANAKQSHSFQIEMNILLATLLELELTGTVENIGSQIYRLAAELDITAY